MIKSEIIECNVCKEKILLRFQIGNYDIPFIFNCPKCGISINGVEKIDCNQLEIENSSIVEEKVENVGYYITLSTEFLNGKLRKFKNFEDIISNNTSPFLSTITLFDNFSDLEEVNNRINNFLKFKYEMWNKIYLLYELLANHNLEYLKKELLKVTKIYNINTELDANMALHQLLVTGLNNILPNGTLKKYTDISIKVFDSKKYVRMSEFVEYIKQKIKFEELNAKIINLYNRWIKDYEKYMAVVTLCIAGKIEKIDKEKYVISTIDFESMKLFYSDSYELILDLLWIPIGLNNIFDRGQFNLFNLNCDIDNFDKYFEQKIKLKRNRALIENETFSVYLNIDRNIRNSISHYDYTVDKNNHKVCFHDKDNTVEMYIVDFCKLCYENIVLITYLNELFYSLIKYDYLQSGIIPNINLLSNVKLN